MKQSKRLSPMNQLSIAGRWRKSGLSVSPTRAAPQWLAAEAAAAHCAAKVGVWDWASSKEGPDAVVAAAGDVPMMEALAEVKLLRKTCPDLKLRLVNVVDLMALQVPSQHPHGISDEAFDAMFTPDKPIIFAFHGYPALIHRLAYRRTNHHNPHVHGFQEEGTTTTRFDMVVLNGRDRFHRAKAVVDRVPRLEPVHAAFANFVARKLEEHNAYIREHGEDLPEIRHWTWQG